MRSREAARTFRSVIQLGVVLGLALAPGPGRAQAVFGVDPEDSQPVDPDVAAPVEEAAPLEEEALAAAEVEVPEVEAPEAPDLDSLSDDELRTLAHTFADQELPALFEQYYAGWNKDSEAGDIAWKVLKDRRENRGAQALLALVERTQGDVGPVAEFETYHASAEYAYESLRDIYGTRGLPNWDQPSPALIGDYREMMEKKQKEKLAARDNAAREFVDDYLRPTFPRFESEAYGG